MAQWCPTCDRPVEGETCEVCGREVGEPVHEKVPLKWKFFIVVTIIYLIWRIYQLISWLSH
jgi:hypothetical protein